MSAALTGPFLAAAGLLCVSGVAKLRAPGPAAVALRTLGIPAHAGLIRAAAAIELGLGWLAVLAGGRAVAVVLAFVYAGFAATALALARRRAACGCFGSEGAPAGWAQMALSAGLAALALTAAIWPPAGLSWVLGHSIAYATALLAGAGGCVYALALAYTELPAAWAAWSGR